MAGGAEAPRLEVEYPADGAVVGPSACGLFVAGRATEAERDGLDLVIVIDTSVSTAAASGGDVDADGSLGRSEVRQVGFVFGESSSDPDDSILAAEVEAARRLLSSLDRRRTRVALVTFAGGPANPGGGEFGGEDRPDALTRTPLTTDHAQVQRALAELRLEVPAGGTHMAAALDRATIELLGLNGARSTVEPRHARAVVFFTDGRPTLPYGVGAEADNVRTALQGAARANRAKVRVTTLAVGPDALEGPLAVLEIASQTGGQFIPVRNAGDVVAAVREVDLSGLEALELRNATTGQRAQPFRMTPDGSWGGFVPLAPGVNRIEVVARSEGGARTRAELSVDFDPEAPPLAIPREFDFLGSGALGDCLRNTGRVDLTAEEARAEQVRKQLRVEIERERVGARKRAAQQRKRLEIEVEEEAAP